MLADDGLVLEVDRFDPGKVSSQDEQILLPTTALPGDYIISLTVVSELDDQNTDYRGARSALGLKTLILNILVHMSDP